ncbi:type 1 glutamine amidotransferase [Sneathiella glossodoripedis]|uniref:type 1 glutamine amidotransferase n=1 Tax=Sneathiella glossodoripedis TaxID=418853 RepID=UPI0004722DE4|nr:type 1 glutamine amidotransferase [Sneathiella glossodoripedis]
MRKIGILQTGIIGGDLAASFGEYPQMFMNMLGTDDFSYTVYSVTENVLPESADECDGWIITGSKHGVYEDHSWITPLENFIRRLVKSGKPTLGICFGHQIMAQALGGKVEKSDKGWGVGIHEYLNLETGETNRLLAFHQDQIVTPPPGTEVTLRSDFCKYAGLRYSNNCISLQPHPEHTIGFTRNLLKLRKGDAIPEPVADVALSSLETQNSHALVINRLKSFFLNSAI